MPPPAGRGGLPGSPAMPPIAQSLSPCPCFLICGPVVAPPTLTVPLLPPPPGRARPAPALLPAWTAALNQSGVQFLSVQTLASALDPTAVDAALQAIKDSGASVILAVAVQGMAGGGLSGASEAGSA